MKEGNSNENPKLKIVFGPLIPVIEKEEICKIPSEKAGEKKVISREQLNVPTIDTLAIKDIVHAEAGEIIKRLTKDGKILTDSSKEEKEEEPIK